MCAEEMSTQEPSKEEKKEEATPPSKEEKKEEETPKLEEKKEEETPKLEEKKEEETSKKQEDPSSMSVVALRVKLKELGIKQQGSKADLVARLKDFWREVKGEN